MDQTTLQQIQLLCCVSHLFLTSNEGAIKASANQSGCCECTIHLYALSYNCLPCQWAAMMWSMGSNDVLSSSLLQAARKRPALANMLIHPWLALPTPGAPLPTPGAPLPTPQLQLTIAPSSPGPSPLGLAPTDGPHTPMPVEGQQHQGMSPCTTASEETMLSCEMPTPDSRYVPSALHSFSDMTSCMWFFWMPVSQL